MSNESAFLADILENPDDDTPRLVYADWLDDRGNEALSARAELIRVQCELALLPRYDSRRSGLEAKSSNLLGIYRKQWTAYSPKEVELGFRRGFIGVVRASIGLYRRHITRLLKVNPIQEIEIINPYRNPPDGKDHEEELDETETAHPGLDRIFSLDSVRKMKRVCIEGYESGTILQSLAKAAKELHALQELEIRQCRVVAAELQPLLRIEDALPALRRLDLSKNSLGFWNSPAEEDALHQLLATPAFPKLEELDLSRNDSMRALDGNVVMPLLYPGTALKEIEGQTDQHQIRILRALLRAQER